MGKRRGEKWVNVPIPRGIADRLDVIVEKRENEVVSRANLVRMIVSAWLDVYETKK